MPRISRFTPIREISAVVIDSETTGLDVASCRLVQISAVRFANGAVLGDQTFDRLVNPGVPIPPQSTAVHGITDAMVAQAPTFAEIKPEFDRFVDDAVLVGQSIGFDLAVLLRETQHAGIAWRQPQFLDTKLLAAALDPASREFPLDALAARLGVAVVDRHHALGDALVTAEVFARLLPRLAEAGVRTLGDAEARSNAQTRIRSRQADQGWYDVNTVRQPDAFESGRDALTLVRLNSFAYRNRVEHVMTELPVIVAPSISLAEAVVLMVERKLRALLAGDADSGRVDGIVTQGDVLKAIARDGALALEKKLESVMTEPVAAMPRDAFVYRALARMQRLGISYLPVEDASRRVVGMLSLRSLLQTEASQAGVLGDSLSTALTPRALANARGELPSLLLQLMANDVPAPEIAAVLGAEMRELLARAAVLAEQRMEAEGSGRPPVPYALLALGRIGRGEAFLGSSLEHALVFASGEPEGMEAQWFGVYAEHLADVLRAAGIETETGSAAATDQAWCRTLEGWRVEVSRWAAQPNDSGESAARFFDFRLAFGDPDLADDVRRLAFDVAAGSGLARALVRKQQGVPSRAGEPRFDLAAEAMAPLEAAARALAIAGRITAVSTAERFAEACARTGLSRQTADELTELHEKLLGIVLGQQGRDLAAGRPPTYDVDLAELDAAARADVELALARAPRVSDVVRVALALV